MDESQILIVDLGGQHVSLIARKIRELGVRSVVLSSQSAGRFLLVHKPKGIILSGGWSSVYSMNMTLVPDAILETGVPILGICLGMHWIARTLGGFVGSVLGQKEYGIRQLIRTRLNDPLLQDVPKKSLVLASHGDSVTVLPRGAKRTSMTQDCGISSFSLLRKNIFAVQFHPECNETEYGTQVLRNFLDICGTKEDWNPVCMVTQIRSELLAFLPRKASVIHLFSGGVDSTVIAALFEPILRERLICVTIDTGSLRENEMREIRRSAVAVKCPLVVIDAKQEFFAALDGLTDTQDKRLAFQCVYEKKVVEIKDTFRTPHLIQGTIAADLIESGKQGGSAHIKTHHNVGNLESFNPLRSFFKDEVRDLARFLGLPDFVSERMPFPGPGLFVRIIDIPVTDQTIALIRWADARVREIICIRGIEKEISQLVVALTVRTAGVKGDERINGYTVVVRAIQSIDFMTGVGYEIPSPIRREIVHTLTGHDEISRVWFDETPKPPATVELQ